MENKTWSELNHHESRLCQCRAKPQCFVAVVMCRAHTARPCKMQGEDMCRYPGKPGTRTTTLLAQSDRIGVTDCKEAGNVIKDDLGVKNLRAKIDNCVFIFPRKIYIYRNGAVMQEPDDVLERPLRGQTAQGPRVTLVGSERIKAPASIEATIELLMHKELDMNLIRELLNFGRFKGIGQWRNGGFGAFEWEEVEAKAAGATRLAEVWPKCKA